MKMSSFPFNSLTMPSLNQKIIGKKIPIQSSSSSSSSSSPSPTPSPLLADNSQQFYLYSQEESLMKLNSNLQNGLTQPEVNRRQQIYGANELAISTKTSFLKVFLEQFSDRLSQILLGTVFLSTVSSYFQPSFHSLTEPGIILTILIINGLVGAIQSKSAESSVAALNKLLPKYSCVLRDGSWSMIPASQLVPGDIILLRTGDHVPADARLIELRSNSFSTDESFLTGENIPILKGINPLKEENLEGISSHINMVFCGSTVTTGSALGLVTQIGKETQIGQINSDVQQSKLQKNLKTPLTQSLNHLSNQLTNLVGTLCLGLWIGNIPNFKKFHSWSHGALHYTKNLIALGVAAVPEGLPAAVTLCLSLGTRKMVKKNIIIRKLSSLETLGCASVICSDKTGTLTTNQMCVTNLVTFDEKEGKFLPHERVLEGNSYSPEGRIRDASSSSSLPVSPLPAPVLQDISQICALCNNAEISYDAKDRNGFTRIGEPTEAALKVLVEKIGRHGNQNGEVTDSSRYNYHSKRINSNYQRIHEFEFDRERKIMSVLCARRIAKTSNNENTRDTDRDHHLLLLCSKGAPEMILSRCKFIKLDDGNVVPLDEMKRKRVTQSLQELSQRPLRVIGVAYKEVKGLEKEQNQRQEHSTESQNQQNVTDVESLEQDLIFTGLCGITDPLRADIPSSLLKCQEAGIRVMMITGDSRDTALSIGYQAGIFNSSSPPSNLEAHVISGKEFNQMNQSQQIQFLQSSPTSTSSSSSQNKIFYRMESRDKKLLIELLQKHCGEVVAMTGDGVNDASALAMADIGIAMGITGTEVTKESSDMILTDDSFVGIVNAIEEGRSVYSNLQSIISYMISCNVGEIGIVLLISLLGLPEIFLPLHLLYINLITDGPPATALSFNPIDHQLMKKPPRNRKESLISHERMWKIALSSLYEMGATVGSYLWWFNERGITWNQLRQWKECQFRPGLGPGTGPFSLTAQCSQLQSILSSASSSSAASLFLSSPQSMALSVLFLIEMLKALSSISNNSSLISVPPWKNNWLLLMILLSFGLHLTIMYTPVLGSLLKISPLTLREWKFVAYFSMPILILDELTKFFQRRRTSRN